jgi:hypothetical protein
VFTPDRDSAVSVDWQKIKIQELETESNVWALSLGEVHSRSGSVFSHARASDTVQDPGRIPRTIECELTQDLVDSVVPGDLVTVAGIVKAVNTEARRHAVQNVALHLDPCLCPGLRLRLLCRSLRVAVQPRREVCSSCMWTHAPFPACGCQRAPSRTQSRCTRVPRWGCVCVWWWGGGRGAQV